MFWRFNMKDASYTLKTQLKNHMRRRCGKIHCPVNAAGFLFTLSELEKLQESQEAWILRTP